MPEISQHTRGVLLYCISIGQWLSQGNSGWLWMILGGCG